MEADDSVEPPVSFREQANRVNRDLWSQGVDEQWDRATEVLDWYQPYESVRASDHPPFDWYTGGRLNASHECLDRHLDARKNRLAIRWEGELGETRSYTYLDLYREVNAIAAALRDLGVETDDVVTLYMPVLPELVASMLACARLGAPHNVVFAGLSADALAARMDRADSACLITCDGYYRRGDAINQKRRADNARMALNHEIHDTVVVERLGELSLGENQHSYGSLLTEYAGTTVDPVVRRSNDVLFQLYTSGTTGEPKRVTHTTGGYLSHVAVTAQDVLDITSEDTYWCTADIGWITGHSYVVYGPLALGTTAVMYEGTPDHPDPDRIWSIVERNAVDVLYTTPTAIRSFMKRAAASPDAHDLSSLRLLGTVGKPIDPSTWEWYYTHVGNEECPVVDTWWQTETGGILVSTLPGIDAMKPGSAGPPLPGVEAAVVNDEGQELPPGERGLLAIRTPWPGMARELAAAIEWGRNAVGDEWLYLPGDEAVMDEDGYITLLGRVDDGLTVDGQRIGTTEIERVIVSVDGVAEAAVIGIDRPLTTAVHAYVSPTLRTDVESLRDVVCAAVENAFGPEFTFDQIVFTPDLPKTRSGKIMRRLLVSIATDQEYGDTSALRNPEIVGELERHDDSET
ncbi:acetate--CoA ligase [Halocatena pleomorpha]|uniref:acetate--CoA ligase n=1 Tax=Halocatena pleomorpha TaxID=1785090 RepID=A0A3P3RC36_9EURY|nr:acetate--CoA ligase [Halocatena pleomorpha]RRJ30518.1 acetate--CoA ligase [Halocatena pleomorpha]